jgi:hypothetical protein
MICPKCKSYRIRRIKREGFLRVRLAPLLGFYPWRCSTCGTVQLLKTRGRPVRKRNADKVYGEAPDIQHADRVESMLVDSKQSGR